VSEVFDPKMPELGEHDPRLCPGEPVLSEWDETDGPRPEWWPPEPHTRVHDWQGGGSLSGKDYQRYCRWCEVKEDAVRARWRACPWPP